LRLLQSRRRLLDQEPPAAGERFLKGAAARLDEWVIATPIHMKFPEICILALLIEKPAVATDGHI
jgi:hypothetical protein